MYKLYNKLKYLMIPTFRIIRKPNKSNKYLINIKMNESGHIKILGKYTHVFM